MKLYYEAAYGLLFICAGLGIGYFDAYKLCTNRRQHMTQEITLRQQVSIEKWTGIIKD